MSNEEPNYMKRRKEFIKDRDLEVNTSKNNRNDKKTNKKRYKAKSGTKNNANLKLKKLLAATALTGITIVGVAKGYDHYQEQKTPITLEQALESGENLEKLGIDKDIAVKIENIKDKLENEDITNEELIKLSRDINEIQFDTIKMKLANTLGCNEEDITLHTALEDKQNGKTVESVDVKNGEKYINRSLTRRENTITDEISDYIRSIGKMQTTMQKIQTGDINRKEIIENYKSAIDKVDKLAATEMKFDKKGNIFLETTKVSELNKSSQDKTISNNEKNNQQLDEER